MSRPLTRRPVSSSSPNKLQRQQGCSSLLPHQDMPSSDDGLGSAGVGLFTIAIIAGGSLTVASLGSTDEMRAKDQEININQFHVF